MLGGLAVPGEAALIPRVVHRIWTGSPLPDHLAAYGETWAAHYPDWDQRLWTDPDELPGLRNRHRVLALEFGGRDLEQHRHRQFARLRHGRTEQFRPGPELMQHIRQLRQAVGLMA